MLPVKSVFEIFLQRNDTNCECVCVYFDCFLFFFNFCIHKEGRAGGIAKKCKHVHAKHIILISFSRKMCSLPIGMYSNIFTISILQWNFWVKRSMCATNVLFLRVFYFLFSSFWIFPLSIQPQRVLVYLNARFILIAFNYFNSNLLTYVKICCTRIFLCTFSYT